MPIIPGKFGNSPNINGDVISKKKGVKLRKGTVSDKGLVLIDLKYSIVAAVLRIIPTNKAIQNTLSIFGSSVKKKVIVIKGKANNDVANATMYSSTLCNSILLTADLAANDKAHIIDNINQSILD